MRRIKRTKSMCSGCPLRDRNRVWAEVPDIEARHLGIVVLSEAPGEQEDFQKRPLCGRSGEFFNFVLGQLGIRRDRLWVTNTICCRPPKNDIGNAEGHEAKFSCLSGLHEELEQAWKEGYRVILAQGNTAVESLGLQGSISKIRGSVYEGDVLKRNGFPPFRVIPTFHPASLARETWKKSDGGRADSTIVYMSDIEKAAQVAKGTWNPPKENFILEPSFQDVVEFVKRDKSLVAVDIETTGLSRYHADIVVIGMATSAEDAIVVPLCERHPGDRYWGPDEPKVVQMLNKVFTTCDLAFQNAFFDVPFLRAKGFTVPTERIKHDTLLLHSVIDPELEHNLGFIVSMYGSTPYWKDEFKNREGSIFDMDPVDMRRYNARDCVVLHQILPPMLEKAKRTKVVSEYEDVILPLMRPVMCMVEKGIEFDASKQSEFLRETKKAIADLETQVREAGHIVPELNLDSPDELRWLLFGQRPSKFSALTSVEARGTKTLKGGKTKDEVKYVWGKTLADLTKAELASLEGYELVEKPTLECNIRKDTARYADLVKLDRISRQKTLYVAPDYRGEKTKSEKSSIGKEALLSYQIALHNRLKKVEEFANPDEEEINSILDVLDFLQVWNNYTVVSKLLKAFTNYKASPDGRIHPHWNIHGTSTGRLSISEPNLQQLPKRGAGSFVRKFFRAQDGYVFVSADFENAEVCLLGCETLDPIILNAYYGGQNIHDINTKMLFGIDESHPLWKSARDAAKVFQFGGLSYGGGDREIFRKVSAKCPDLHLTFAEFRKSKERWMDAHPAYVVWKEEIAKLVMSERRVYNEFGRMREFLSNDKDIVKEAMNFKIQSAGASILNRALVRMFDRTQALGMKAFPVLQIHDQVVFECPLDELDTMKTIISEEMTRPFMYKRFSRHIRIEMQVGPTFGDLE